jgi:hypothetical protein
VKKIKKECRPNWRLLACDDEMSKQLLLCVALRSHSISLDEEKHQSNALPFDTNRRTRSHLSPQQMMVATKE